MNGIYIHIPFCKRKCSYCDFVSFAGMEESTGKYLDVLENEMRAFSGKKADTIFIGGGTPSILSAEQIRRLTSMCAENFDIADGYEFTMEVNPGTLDSDKINAMLEGGINRVSVGVQSFNDNELRTVGRIHTAQTAYNTVCELNKAGLTNISIDLMTALPEQTMESLRNTLETAVSLPVTHISAYSLIIEEGTPLYKAYSAGEVLLPDDDADREMYSFAVDFLTGNGFKQYEISNFARNGYECRHNIKYWTWQPYIGLGAAAHSFDGQSRSYNTSDLNEYLNGALANKTILSEKDKISEYIITGLRMNRGLNTEKFRAAFGIDIDELYGGELSKFINLGLMKKNGQYYSLTRRGVDVSNALLCEFV